MNHSEFKTLGRSLLDQLDESVRQLLVDVGRLNSASSSEFATAQKQLSEAQAIAGNLREQLALAAELIGESVTEWHDRRELESCLQRIEDGLLELAIQNSQHSLVDLAETIRRGSVVHPRLCRVITTLDEVRQRAAAELDQVIASHEPTELPGPASGTEWLTWAWTLDAFDLERSLENFSEAVPSLVQFLLDVEPEQWIPGAVTLTATNVELDASTRPSPHTTVAERTDELPAVIAADTASDSISNDVTIGHREELIDQLPPRPLAEPIVIEPVESNPIESQPDAVAQSEPPITIEPIPIPKPASTGVSVAAPTTAAARSDDALITSSPTASGSQAAAQLALGVSSSQQPQHCLPIIWHLLAEGRVGLAAQLAGVLEQISPNSNAGIPAWLCEVLAIAPCVRHASGDVALRLQEMFSHFSEDGCFRQNDDDWNVAMRLLVFAAALRPSLLAPETGAGRLLHGLYFDQEQTSLFELCNAAAEFSAQRQPLQFQVLKRAFDRNKWESDYARLRTETEKWFTDAGHRTLKFQAATEIFQDWLADDGIIHRTLEPLRDRNFGARNSTERQRCQHAVGQNIINLRNEALLRVQVDRQDKRASKRKSIQIVGSPFRRMIEFSAQAAQFAEDWLKLEQSRPPAHDDYSVRMARQFQDRLEKTAPTVRTELDKSRSSDTSEVKCAATIASKAIDDVVNLFDPNMTPVAEDGSVRQAMRLDLLRIRQISIDDSGMPQAVEPHRLLQQLLAGLAEGLPEWEPAFDIRAEAGDFVATRQILIYLQQTQMAKANLDRLQRKQETLLDDSRCELGKQLRALRKQIEEAVAFGLLKEDQRSEMMSEVHSTEQRLAGIKRFSPEHARLKGIRAHIAALRDERVDQFRRRLNEANPQPNDRARIEDVLNRGDVFSANDYLDLIAKNEQLPTDHDATSDPFLTFFGNDAECARSIDAFLAKSSSKGFMRILKPPESGSHEPKTGATLSRLQFGQVPGRQRKRAYDMMQSWFYAAQIKRTTETELRGIIEGLGFTLKSVSVKSSGRIWADVETEPLRDRLLCPLPNFGSWANGRYRILCIWDRPSEEDIVAQVGETHHCATFVFYFGRLTVQRRRDLSRLCQEKRRTFIVLDDNLMAFLCAARGSRLPVLFACGLPFTMAADIYPMAASVVPPEMFYGRQRERNEVLSPYGSCFIYGGRQLGKTALLRDAERAFNREGGHVALWLDLKDARVGIDRDFWSFLAEQLKKVRVVPENVPSKLGDKALFGHIETWLNVSPNRRLLLLLDEADVFLRHDSGDDDGKAANAYSRVTSLKGLMDRTNRRFKVVFAGLHDVQRTTRLGNHPLAHYGEPICIGPLLENGEWREARALVEQPLGALGFRFDSADLVTRILSHTNYYPSLIQLYCNYLQRYVTNPKRREIDFRTSPPFVITEDQIEAAYQSEDLRKAIKDRFTWTLQLDQRYEVLANIIAYHAVVEDAERGLQGLTISEVADRAFGWWKEGFSEGSPDNPRQLPDEIVRVLLDEMVGLGILRRSDGNYYLRNQNVLLLMGNEDDIAGALIRHREPALEQLDPAAFRVPLQTSEHRRPELRSPLTAAQEGSLKERRNGVTLLIGTVASGIDNARAALVESFGLDFLIEPNTLELDGFQAALAALNDRRNDGTTLIFIGSQEHWTADWMRQSLQKINRLTTDKAWVRIVFAADAERSHQLAANPRILIDLQKEGVETLCLTPWQDPAVRQWLEECQFGPNDSKGREELRRVTGNWPYLLTEFYKRHQRGGGAWADQLHQLELDLVRDPLARAVRRAFAVDTADAADVLRQVANYGPETEEQLCQLIGNSERVSITLAWADRLRLVQFGEKGWELDPVIKRVLLAEEG